MTEITQKSNFVRLDIFGVPNRSIPAAFLRMALHRMSLNRIKDVSFWKLLGTGSGKTFTVRDADANHWAILTVWTNQENAEHFDNSRIVHSWQKISTTHLKIHMTALSSKGQWAKQEPFGRPTTFKPANQPIAVITRARIKPQWWLKFWSSVPPVSADLHASPGLLLSLGIGEAPIGLQGTFSLWENNQAITNFSTGRLAHRSVIERTHQTGWYAEELFARFVVSGIHGSLRHQTWEKSW